MIIIQKSSSMSNFLAKEIVKNSNQKYAYKFIKTHIRIYLFTFQLNLVKL